MCANGDQMCDRMCTKVLTTDNPAMLLFHKSTTGQGTTKIDTISGYHLGVRHGPHPICRYVYLRFASGAVHQEYLTKARPFEVIV